MNTGGGLSSNFFVFACPKYLEYNLDIQHSFGAADVVDVEHNGNFGYDIFFQNSLGNAYAVKGDNFGGLSNTKPDPRFTYVTNLTNDAHSNYNGGTLGYRHQAKYGYGRIHNLRRCLRKNWRSIYGV